MWYWLCVGTRWHHHSWLESHLGPFCHPHFHVAILSFMRSASLLWWKHHLRLFSMLQMPLLVFPSCSSFMAEIWEIPTTIHSTKAKTHAAHRHETHIKRSQINLNTINTDIKIDIVVKESTESISLNTISLNNHCWTFPNLVFLFCSSGFPNFVSSRCLVYLYPSSRDTHPQLLLLQYFLTNMTL